MPEPDKLLGKIGVAIVLGRGPWTVTSDSRSRCLLVTAYSWYAYGQVRWT